jgi:hypothetical protein
MDQYSSFVDLSNFFLDRPKLLQKELELKSGAKDEGSQILEPFGEEHDDDLRFCVNNQYWESGITFCYGSWLSSQLAIHYEQGLKETHYLSTF